MKTQKEVEVLYHETIRLISVWSEKKDHPEYRQVLDQLIGQKNILFEVLK